MTTGTTTSGRPMATGAASPSRAGGTRAFRKRDAVAVAAPLAEGVDWSLFASGSSRGGSFNDSRGSIAGGAGTPTGGGLAIPRPPHSAAESTSLLPAGAGGLPERGRTEAASSGTRGLFPHGPPSGHDLASMERQTLLATACLLACLRGHASPSSPGMERPVPLHDDRGNTRTPTEPAVDDPPGHRRRVVLTAEVDYSRDEEDSSRDGVESSRKEMEYHPNEVDSSRGETTSRDEANSFRDGGCSSRGQAGSLTSLASRLDGQGYPRRRGHVTGGSKKGSKVGRLRRKKRLPRWPGGPSQATKKRNAASTNSRAPGSRGGDSEIRDSCGLAGVPRRDSRYDRREISGDEAAMAPPPRRQEEASETAMVFAELHRLKAVSKTPSLLYAQCPLHQELGVAILLSGLHGCERNTGRPDTRCAYYEIAFKILSFKPYTYSLWRRLRPSDQLSQHA